MLSAYATDPTFFHNGVIGPFGINVKPDTKYDEERLKLSQAATSHRLPKTRVCLCTTAIS